MDYHDLYLKTDVLLPCDVAEEFRNICYDNFGLDPFNSFTAPGFAWDALLKLLGVELEALSDEDMYLFFEQGIRGGYSNVHENYSKANHLYLPDFNPGEESKFLIYWDKNSLYPSVMIEPLPVRDYCWGTEDEIKSIFKLCKEGRYDEIPPCTLSVDLKHDPNNFDKEKVFAMCPDFFVENGVKKLAHHLYDKKDYVIHHRTLKKYLHEGMILEKINRVVLYTEEAWMKGYIEFCIEQQKKAELAGNDFLVDFWKLMCNSIFGKTMENIRKRINFKLVNDAKKLQKELNKPTVQSVITYNLFLLVGLHLAKSKLTLNKHIYTGQAILDNSK